MDKTLRLSDLIGKHIVNIYDGVRLGTITESDLLFHTETGEIDSMILPNRNGLSGILLDKNTLNIPWAAIHKIGKEVIIVDLGQSNIRYKKSIY